MLHAALEGAALNVRINLNGLNDPEFVGWKTDEVQSLRSTSALVLEEIQSVVDERLQRS
jgi:formiminotetrahydrofolate cyclodeaminase